MKYINRRVVASQLRFQKDRVVHTLQNPYDTKPTKVVETNDIIFGTTHEDVVDISVGVHKHSGEITAKGATLQRIQEILNYRNVILDYENNTNGFSGTDSTILPTSVLG